MLCVPQEMRVGAEECYTHMHLVVSSQKINDDGHIVLVVPLVSPESRATGDSKQWGPYRKSRIRIPADQKIWDADAPFTQQGDSLAKTEQLFCLSQDHLRGLKRCGCITDDALGAVEAGICDVLDIPAIAKRKPAEIMIAGKPIRPPVLKEIPRQ